MGAVCYQRLGCPDLGVCTSRFEPFSPQLGPLGRRGSVRRLQRPSRLLEELWNILAWGRQRNRTFFSSMIRGVSNPREGSKILSFLFRPRLVCNSLLHLRSSRRNCLEKS
jgi:hypothetical protein